MRFPAGSRATLGVLFLLASYLVEIDQQVSMLVIAGIILEVLLDFFIIVHLLIFLLAMHFTSAKSFPICVEQKPHDMRSG